MRAGAGFGTIVNWTVTYADQAAIAAAGGNPDSVCVLTYGYSGVGFGSVEIPAPPPGQWSLRLELSVHDGGSTVTVPYYVRLDVTAADASPAPSASPCAGGRQYN